MEKLIKIQSLIMEIEEITLSDSKYYSKFLYKDEHTMQVETYAWKQARTYKDLFEDAQNMVVYIINNNTIEFHIWK